MFWVFISWLFGSLTRFIFRIFPDNDFERNQCKSMAVVSHEDDSELDECRVKQSDGGGGGGGDGGDGGGGEDVVAVESVQMVSSSKYEFSSGENITGFMNEPKKFSLFVHEMYMDFDNHEIKSGISSHDHDFRKPKLELGFVLDENPVEKVEIGEEQEVSEFDSSVMEENISNLNPRISHSIDTFSYEFLSDEESVTEKNLASIDEARSLVLNLPENLASIDDTRESEQVVVMSDLSDESDGEFIELKPLMENSSVVEDDSRESREDPTHYSEESRELTLGFEEEGSFSRFEEEDEEDDEMEHDDVIEQLKAELKNARTGGLATIFEECESPKVLQELKPLKIEEKLEHKDRMMEIQKVYKSYLDKMRKLDILNSQTMHAISLLKLKDPTQSNRKSKSSDPSVKLPPLLRRCLKRRSEPDPILKTIRELQKDFETVYVGQVCLSWEILHWQYRKSIELLQHDVQEFRRYNQIAGDFQLFRVLLERFIENEPFQNRKRIENYVTNRCGTHNNVLQVPIVKDDLSRDKKRSREKVEDVITITDLREIVWESMCVFREFIRGDKYEDLVNCRFKGPHQTQVAPFDSINSELLMDIRTDLQKKEKRLKDILRSGNCIVKKKVKSEEVTRLNRVAFIAQVELKLISRVVNMAKLTTDQLVWCHDKLIKLNFTSRKIQFEPSFSFFPS